MVSFSKSFFHGLQHILTSTFAEICQCILHRQPVSPVKGQQAVRRANTLMKNPHVTSKLYRTENLEEMAKTKVWNKPIQEMCHVPNVWILPKFVC